MRGQPFPSWPVYGEEEKAQLLDVLEKSSWGIGRRVGKIEAFQEAFARFHGRRYGICTTNGTQALEVMLSAGGIGAGDEVIVPSYTFIATASAVCRVGATPVFADADPKTLTLSPSSVEAALTGRTAAVIAVHFAGQFADMDSLALFAERRNLLLLEDAAQAHGGRRHGRAAGSWGKGAAFSFQYSKNMTAGEGGIILTDDGGFAERCWETVWHGRRRQGLWYEHFEVTSNFRMTEWQAAVLLAQLDRLPLQLERRHANALYLDEQIGGLAGTEAISGDGLMEPHPRHLYPIRFDAGYFEGVPKRRLVEALNAEGIPLLEGYGHPLYRNPAFLAGRYGIRRCRCGAPPQDFSSLRLPAAEAACREVAWLFHPVLLSQKDDLDDIAAALEKVSRLREDLRAPS